MWLRGTIRQKPAAEWGVLEICVESGDPGSWMPLEFEPTKSESPIHAEEIAQSLMDGIGFSKGILRDVPGRFEEVERYLSAHGYRLKYDESVNAYNAVKYR